MAKDSQPLAPLDCLQRYSLDEAQRYLRISRPLLYRLIHTNGIATLKIGKRRYVPGSEIARLSAAPEAPKTPPLPAPQGPRRTPPTRARAARKQPEVA